MIIGDITLDTIGVVMPHIAVGEGGVLTMDLAGWFYSATIANAKATRTQLQELAMNMNRRSEEQGYSYVYVQFDSDTQYYNGYYKLEFFDAAIMPPNRQWKFGLRMKLLGREQDLRPATKWQAKAETVDNGPTPVSLVTLPRGVTNVGPTVPTNRIGRDLVGGAEQNTPIFISPTPAIIPYTWPATYLQGHAPECEVWDVSSATPGANDQRKKVYDKSHKWANDYVVITNGLLKLRLRLSSDQNPYLSCWDDVGNAWTEDITFQPMYEHYGGSDRFEFIRISPDEVVLDVLFRRVSGTIGPTSRMRLWIRRGSYLVRFEWFPGTNVGYGPALIKSNAFRFRANNALFSDESFIPTALANQTAYTFAASWTLNKPYLCGYIFLRTPVFMPRVGDISYFQYKNAADTANINKGYLFVTPTQAPYYFLEAEDWATRLGVVQVADALASPVASGQAIELDTQNDAASQLLGTLLGTNPIPAGTYRLIFRIKRQSGSGTSNDLRVGIYSAGWQEYVEKTPNAATGSYEYMYVEWPYDGSETPAFMAAKMSADVAVWRIDYVAMFPVLTTEGSKKGARDLNEQAFNSVDQELVLVPQGWLP